MQLFYLLIIFCCCCITFGKSFASSRCDSPPTAQYLPDQGFGTYCRLNASYSQIDLIYLLEVSNLNDDVELQLVQKIFSSSLILNHGLYSNNETTNNVAFVIFSQTAKVVVPFGSLTSSNEVADNFNNIINWKKQLGENGINYTNALEFVDGIFNYTNQRAKILIIAGNNAHQSQFEYNNFDLLNAINIRNKRVKIFTIGFSTDPANLNKMDTFFSKISTPGWYFPLLVFSDTSNSLSKTFSDKARQANCICRDDNSLRQFFAQTPSINPVVGPYVAEYYADCIFVDDFDTVNFKDATEICNSYLGETRPITIMTAEKWNFINNFISGVQETFWSGKNGSIWPSYSIEGSEPVTYLPASFYDPTIQDECQNVYSISPGQGAIFVPYINNSHILCSADFQIKSTTFCESRAIDSFNNPRICGYKK